MTTLPASVTDFYEASMVCATHSNPHQSSIKEALANNKAEWHDALNHKMKQIVDREVFQFVDKPKRHRPVETRWVLLQKRGVGGIKTKKKARIVAMGFEQRKGVNCKSDGRQDRQRRCNGHCLLTW